MDMSLKNDSWLIKAPSLTHCNSHCEPIPNGLLHLINSKTDVFKIQAGVQERNSNTWCPHDFPNVMRAEFLQRKSQDDNK